MADLQKRVRGEHASQHIRAERATHAPRLAIALWGGALAVAVAACCASLGLWQWHKYSAKTALQAELEARGGEAPIDIRSEPVDAEKFRYRHVAVTGEFDAAAQILVDNRIDPLTERAGYEVVTPLKLAGGDLRILVDRGWVPAGADRRTLPAVAPPKGTVHLTGIATVPPTKFFTLAPQAPPAGHAGEPWQPVWQNLDLAAFRAAVPWRLQPVVVALDAAAPFGYGRNWPRPDDRSMMNLSYALQWFGFAASAVGIWLFFLLRRHT